MNPSSFAKLDVAGAFDKIDRRRVCTLLTTRLEGRNCGHELKYLLGQLFTHTLTGSVPGGNSVSLRPNIGN